MHRAEGDEALAKRKTLRATEHLKPEIAAERVAFQEAVQEIAPEDLVFVDESGVTTSMVRTYARAPRGERAVGRSPAGRYERLTLLGAITLEGISALMTIPAFTNRPVFAAFVEQVLVPTLRPGQVVVLDNLPAHKYPEVEAAVRGAGCRLLFLPRYSPEFNPIEPSWSKVKNELRSRAARTLESLQEAVCTAVDHVTSRDALGYFRHCGYHVAPDP